MKAKKTGLKNFIGISAVSAITVCIVLCGIYSLNGVKKNASKEGSRLLEESIYNAAITCYANEGIYPPDIDYLKKHYGIIIDDKNYYVHYEIFADNILPDVTVTAKK